MKFLAPILLLSCVLNGQALERLLPPQTFGDPKATLQKVRADRKSYQDGTYHFIVGKCHSLLNEEDSAIVHFVKARDFFRRKKDEAAVADAGLEAYRIISSAENYERFGKAFLEDYRSYARKTNSAYRLAVTDMEDAINAADSEMPDAFAKALALYDSALKNAELAASPDLIGRIYANRSQLLTDFGHYAKAREMLQKAYPYVVASKDDFRLFAWHYNAANSYFFERDYARALAGFEKAGQIRLPYYKLRAMRKLYEKIEETADSLGDAKTRQHYHKLHEKLSKQLDDPAHIFPVYAADKAMEIEKKNREISFLQTWKEKFEHNRIVFSAALFVVFLLALYSFVRWKKVDRRRRLAESDKERVENQHLQAISEIDKLRELVIEDHIVLKNRSKLYLDNLLYVKADDHYLHFVPVDGKPSFLRGKLSEIQEQLPPNFRRSHRSYIINTNFVKSVNSRGIFLMNGESLPVSREFKL